MDPRRANGTRRTALRREFAASDAPCWLCGMPIPRGVGHAHPYAMELDEVVPVSKGGDPLDRANIRRAHRCCNQWRGGMDAADAAKVADAARAVFGMWSCPAEFVLFARNARSRASNEKGKRKNNVAVMTSREW